MKSSVLATLGLITIVSFLKFILAARVTVLNLIFQFGKGFFFERNRGIFHESTDAEVKKLLFYNNSIQRLNEMKLLFNEPIKRPCWPTVPICSNDL